MTGSDARLCRAQAESAFLEYERTGDLLKLLAAIELNDQSALLYKQLGDADGVDQVMIQNFNLREIYRHDSVGRNLPELKPVPFSRFRFREELEKGKR